MIFLEDDALLPLIDFAALAGVIRQAFAGELGAPPRTHHTLPGSFPATLLLMPAWRPGRSLGVKVVTVEPARSARGHHAVDGLYLLFDAVSGAPTAVLGARTLTAARTAAVSALGTSYLARKNASTLLMVGTGNLAPFLIRAHAAVRPIRRVLLWGRDPYKARALAESMSVCLPEIEFEAAPNLEAATPLADIISVATASRQPLIFGSRVAPGTHVDLVGSFTPLMREADEALFARALVHVDTFEALDESGDLLAPLQSGVLTRAAIRDLAALIADPGLTSRPSERVTVFKSVGTAIADLAAAEYFLTRAAGATPPRYAHRAEAL